MNRQELQTLAGKAKEKHEQFKHKICVCCGASCISSGSEEVLKKMQEEIKAKGLDNEIEVIPSGCMGPCTQGPLVKYLPEQTIYQKVNSENTSLIVQKQVIEKRPIENMLLFADSREKPFINANEDPFFKRQMKIALKDCGDIKRRHSRE